MSSRSGSPPLALVRHPLPFLTIRSGGTSSPSLPDPGDMSGGAIIRRTVRGIDSIDTQSEGFPRDPLPEPLNRTTPDQ